MGIMFANKALHCVFYRDTHVWVSWDFVNKNASHIVCINLTRTYPIPVCAFLVYLESALPGVKSGWQWALQKT
jgi:hypothetical protein